MSLDRLVEEIRRRAEDDLQQQAARQANEEAAVATGRDARIAAVGEQTLRTTEREITRERAQKLASAKLEARKLVYAAEESRMSDALGETRELLADYTDSDEYPKVVKRMVAYASEVLGKSTKVMGRSADAALLKKVAGSGFDPTPQAILGGIVAESADGSRRLNLSFDELLRLREDRVRQLLAA
jgi:V/A-type H+-transporting ATPase subunit E